MLTGKNEENFELDVGVVGVNDVIKRAMEPLVRMLIAREARQRAALEATLSQLKAARDAAGM
ncbi:MAG: hypothetical protein [Microvirus sp.]|nr:MAG: hypothetical protein [Microvirus sp.]